MNFEGIDDFVPEDVGRYILSFLDVPTLVQKKASSQEAVGNYSKYNLVDAEEFAQTYGWPIDRWDVSHVQDLSELFRWNESFNENIASWNVSNVSTMDRMFYCASNFNQDLSSWNVSNVTTMDSMFQGALKFNQDLSAWNVSNVTNMAQIWLRCFTAH
eukprot:scaffold15872_cov36-Attheya_sp.AAC.2